LVDSPGVKLCLSCKNMLAWCNAGVNTVAIYITIMLHVEFLNNQHCWFCCKKNYSKSNEKKTNCITYNKDVCQVLIVRCKGKLLNPTAVQPRAPDTQPFTSDSYSSFFFFLFFCPLTSNHNERHNHLLSLQGIGIDCCDITQTGWEDDPSGRTIIPNSHTP
jgi:hypothetical protein